MKESVFWTLSPCFWGLLRKYIVVQDHHLNSLSFFVYELNSLKATYSVKPIDEMSAKIGPIMIAQRILTV